MITIKNIKETTTMNTVPTTTMINVMQSFEKGYTIEVKNKGGDTWYDAPLPEWDWFNKEYRVKKVMPSIDWSHVSDEWTYLYVSVDNAMCVLCKEKPMTNGDKLVTIDGHRIISKGQTLRAAHFKSFRKGHGMDSYVLLERPV